MDEAIDEALRAGRGVLAIGQHPALAWRVRRARERGELVAVLRGRYATPAAAASFAVRVLALLSLDPDAVLIGASAAVALGWREPAPGEAVEAASRRVQGSRPGFLLTRRSIDPDLVVERGEALDSPSGAGTVGVQCTNEAVTTLDLARRDGADSIDDALRGGQPLAALHATLAQQKGRAGNRRLRTYLADSRDEPWSAAERAGHRSLRAEAVTGWVANWAVERAPGRTVFLDVALPHLWLGIEIDGYEHHGTRAAFRSDRLRDLDLRRLGWEVMRVPADWVLEDPGRFAALVAELAAQRAGLLGVAA